MQDWPECVKPENKGIYWNIRMYSSPNVAIIKDTEKEDIEEKLIQSWEEKEPGRKEKAAKTRERYLLSIKQ